MYATLIVMSCLLVGQSEQSDEQLRGRVMQLVRQLDSNELAEREAAEAALVELGSPALRLLPPITPRTPAEVKQRLERVISAVQTAEAEAATRPTRVSLQGKMSLQEALEQLQQQTGNQIVGYEGRDAELELDLTDVPYWQALDEILDQAGLTINTFGGIPSALTVAAAPEQQVPRRKTAAYSGVFRFEPTRIEAVRDLRNPDVQGLKVTLSISWEPRITPISISQSLEQLTATTDQGHQLEVDNQPTQLSSAVESTISAVEIDLPFELPARGATQIASLQGNIQALVPSRMESFEFDDLANADHIDQRRAGVVVILQGVRKNLDLHEVRVRVRFDDAAEALESHRGWIYSNPAYLEGPNGERVENAGLQATLQESNQVGLAYLFDLDDDLSKYTFVYQTPALLVRMPVEYELKDIPLP